MPEPEAKIDLYGDWIEHMRCELTRLRLRNVPGIPKDAKEQLRIALLFFRFARRRIQPRVRAVVRAKEFTCPEEHRAVVERIASASEAGEDLLPYLSTKTTSATTNDVFLADWGFHHLHLGSVRRDDGFVERTGPVLLVRVMDSAIAFIDVRQHGNGQPWGHQDLVQILHDNWPESIERFALRGILPGRQLTDDEVRHARAAGIQVPIAVRDGTVYAGIGGGVTTSRDNIQDVGFHDWLASRLADLENDIRRQQIAIVDQLREHGKSPGSPPTFQLVFEGGKAYIAEEATRTGFYPLSNFWDGEF